MGNLNLLPNPHPGWSVARARLPRLHPRVVRVQGVLLAVYWRVPPPVAHRNAAADRPIRDYSVVR